MTTILTETSTFTATVAAPADGDSANGATFSTGLQSLANRTKYLNDQRAIHAADIAALEAADTASAAAVSYRGYLSGSAIAYAGTITLNGLIQYPIGSWSLASNEIQVPSAGVYRVSVIARVTSTGTDNPTSAVVHIMCGASGIVGRALGDRWSATAGLSFQIVGHAEFSISTPSSSKIWFKNQSAVADTLTIADGGSGAVNQDFHAFLIERIGDAT